MNSTRILRGFVNAALHKRQGLALWSLPENNGMNALVAGRHEIMTVNRFEDISERKGFVFAPFLPEGHFPTILLEEGKIYRSLDEITGKYPPPENDLNYACPGNFHKDSRDDYLRNCRAVIQLIDSGKAEKVVLSRIKKVSRNKHPADMFLQLKSHYPGAFCYLFYTPQSGLWLGASPETLLSSKDDFVYTMALAGTRKCDMADKSDKPWPAKERKEQNHVTRFIEDKLRSLGIKQMMISTPYTMAAGSVEHIRTDFEIDLKETAISTGQIVKVLHPTPAVCGQPREAALEVIKQTEKHDRAYYTGFLGPLNFDGRTSLYVNLRCMNASGNSYNLFAGGGITADSDAGAEWEETEMKAWVLEKIIGND